MRYILLLVVFVLCCVGRSSAQTVVSGHAEDKTGKPLEGCSVMIEQADTLVGGTITDAKGDFEIRGLAGGSYVCRVSLLGFKELSRRFSVEVSVRLPKFVMYEDPTQLKEVTVEGDRRDFVKRRAGSTTYYLSERAKNSRSAYEALAEVPQLVVNPVQQSITMDDGTAPLVLINGVKRANYLSVLDPKLIESVEVVDNPPARYRGDESVKYVLNIRMKRGTAVYVNGNLNAQHSIRTKEGMFFENIEAGSPNSSLYLSMQQLYFGNDHSEISSSTSTPDMEQNLGGRSKGNTQSYYASLGGDYVFSDKDYAAFSFVYIGNPSTSEQSQQGEVAYPASGLYSATTVWQNGNGKYYAPNAQLYYKHTFSDKQSIEATGMYSYSLSSSKSERHELNDFYRTDNNIDYNNKRHFAKLSIDYALVLGKSVNLSAGSNTSYAYTGIDDRCDQLPLYGNRRWQQYLYAGIDNNRSSSKFNYMLSLALDYMHSNAGGVRNGYANLLPAVSLSYRFNDHHTIRLDYSRGRSNPDVSNMNPLNSSTDSLYVSVGNPYLTPSFTDYVSFSYNFNCKRFSLNPRVSYSVFSDYIDNDGWLEGDVYVATYNNQCVIRKIALGLDMRYNFSCGNIGTYCSYYKLYQHGMEFDGNNWSASVYANVYYKKWYFNFYAQYTTATALLHTRSKDRPYCHASISRNLPKNWSVGMYFENFIFTGMRNKNWLVNGDYRSFSTNRMTDRTPEIRLTVRYTFKNKVEQKWRNKKRLDDSDRELQNIKAN